MGGRGSLRGDGAWPGGRGGVAGGLEQGAWGLGRVSKGQGAGAWREAEGLGSGREWTLGDGMDIRMSDIVQFKRF